MQIVGKGWYLPAQAPDWPGPVNKNLEPGPVNTNWGPWPGPWAKRRARD